MSKGAFVFLEFSSQRMDYGYNDTPYEIKGVDTLVNVRGLGSREL